MAVKNERYNQNRLAFLDIIGNPYEFPEPIEGHYNAIQQRSAIGTNSYEESRGTVNPARPSAIDFVCDVDRTVQLGLTRYANQVNDDLLTVTRLFRNTYITEQEPIFTQKERITVEQIIGRLFLERKISPIGMYFLTIKR